MTTAWSAVQPGRKISCWRAPLDCCVVRATSYGRSSAPPAQIKKQETQKWFIDKYEGILMN